MFKVLQVTYNFHLSSKLPTGVSTETKSLKKTTLLEMQTCRKAAINVRVKYSCFNSCQNVSSPSFSLYKNNSRILSTTSCEILLIFHLNTVHAQVYAVDSLFLFQLRQNSV